MSDSMNSYVDLDKLNTSEVVYSGIQFVIAIAMIVVGRIYTKIQIKIFNNSLGWVRI